MSFSLANVLGWTTGDVLTEDQINQIDQEHANAIDGADGGAYTLSAPLSISGDTVTIDDLEVSGQISGDVTIGSGISNVAEITGTAIVGSDLDVTGNANITGALTANGNAYLGSDTGDSVYFYGTVVTPVQVALGGRMCETGQVVSTTSSTVNVLTHQNIFLNAALNSTTTTTALTDSGSVNGDWFVLCNGSDVVQNFSGTVTISSMAALSGRKYLKISGTWTQINAWSLT